ncbi:LlaMI family restriction endonuclease [Clostridium butyricum]|uniref:LlaMI family restriction endonuclease n=1 Tax=Clostridium butyricum TaxID=1492 RepID=UPI003D112319
MTYKEMIIKLFRENVKGKCADSSSANQKHDGKDGHWLERQFGIKANADNKADLWGYELKNQTTSKTTFGDWSANEYIYTSDQYKNLFKGNNKKERQDSFLQIFGQANTEKGGRHSWSGTPCPKIDGYNTFGQKLQIVDNKAIVVVYSFSKDARKNKNEIVPQEFRKEGLILARWFGETSPSTKRVDTCLKLKLEKKFNDKGWFTCKKDENGKYNEICFGEPINFNSWIKLVANGTVYFDSGMYEGNSRPYSMWRANNTFWDSLITERYN